MTDPRFAAAASLVRDAVGARAVPSAALAVGVRDAIYVRESWGVTSYTPEGRPVDGGTLYDMASVTKIMATGMIALKLLEAGEIDLCDPIGRFLGGAVPEDKREITLFHLLTHTGGLPAHFLLEERIDDPADAAGAILREPLAAPVGSGAIYSCMGFILLGKILEDLLGGRLDRLAEKLVFAPLGMRATGYHPLRGGKLPDPCAAENAAFTEKDPQTGAWLRGVVHDENARFLEGVSGNAGVFSDLEDGIRFARMLACGGWTPQGRFLAPSTLRAAIRNYTPGQSESRGLAFQLANGYRSCSGGFFDPRAFGHTGFTGPHLLVSPETGLYVLLLTNRVHPNRENDAHLRLRRVLHTAAFSALPL